MVSNAGKVCKGRVTEVEVVIRGAALCGGGEATRQDVSAKISIYVSVCVRQTCVGSEDDEESTRRLRAWGMWLRGRGSEDGSGEIEMEGICVTVGKEAEKNTSKDEYFPLSGPNLRPRVPLYHCFRAWVHTRARKHTYVTSPHISISGLYRR